eukprot:scaffold5818_cov186-Skeletonema_marinoi.AAC.3
MTMTMTPFLSALLLGTMPVADGLTSHPSKKENDHHHSRRKDNNTRKPHKKQQVKTTLCSTQDCNDSNGEAELVGVCKTYLTPISTCYNAQFLFPNDESWSDVDMFDELHYRPEMKKAPPNLKRTFYTSKDGSCSSDVDYSWIQPFEVCEGPFGLPRPWGKFSLVDGDDVESDSLDDQEIGFSTVVSEE